MSLFSGLNNAANNNIQNQVLNIIEQAKANGKITDTQYSTIMQHKNNPEEIVNALLQTGLINNSQVSTAREQYNTFFRK